MSMAGENEKEDGMVVTGALGGASRHAQAGKRREPAEPAGTGAQPGAHGELGDRLELGEWVGILQVIPPVFFVFVLFGVLVVMLPCRACLKVAIACAGHNCKVWEGGGDAEGIFRRFCEGCAR